MRPESATKVSCLFIVILSQSITVTCQNETIPTTSPEDLITSSHSMTMKDPTSSAAESTEQKEPSTTETTEPLVEEKTTTTTKPLTTPQVPTAKTTTLSEMNTSGKKSVTMTTSHSTHPPVHPSKPTHHTRPIHPGDGTHHEDKNTTNKTHDGHVVDPGSHSTMGYPDEPLVVEASTDEKDDSNWQISVYVVCALLIGIVAFVIVMVVKSNRELKRRASLRERKRPVTRKDNAHALKMIKTEEPKSTHGAERKEKRLSMHSRVGTEESIPLLQLHIGDGEHPVLSKNSEEQEIQPDQPSTSYKDSKLLIEENGNTVDVPFI